MKLARSLMRPWSLAVLLVLGLVACSDAPVPSAIGKATDPEPSEERVIASRPTLRVTEIVAGTKLNGPPEVTSLTHEFQQVHFEIENGTDRACYFHALFPDSPAVLWNLCADGRRKLDSFILCGNGTSWQELGPGESFQSSVSPGSFRDTSLATALSLSMSYVPEPDHADEEDGWFVVYSEEFVVDQLLTDVATVD